MNEEDQLEIVDLRLKLILEKAEHRELLLQYQQLLKQYEELTEEYISVVTDLTERLSRA